jgi:hypothetical protein
MAANASAEAVFQVRAVADVELLLSSDFSEHDESVHHQLRVFEAYELGLLATWETPDALICVEIAP